MFCPECKAEYSPGFTHCSDCDVNLVAELPKPEADIEDAELRHIWTGNEQSRCLELCNDFIAEEIPYEVEQSRHQYLKGVDQKYRISVPQEFFEKAKRVVIRGRK